MSTPVVSNFMRQQGFRDEPADTCSMRFAGLNFQPRIVFSLVIVGIVLQSPWVFLLLSAVLWWNVLFPGFNPFERAYNRFIATPRGRVPLGAAPGPGEGARPPCQGRGAMVGAPRGSGEALPAPHLRGGGGPAGRRDLGVPGPAARGGRWPGGGDDRGAHRADRRRARRFGACRP